MREVSLEQLDLDIQQVREWVEAGKAQESDLAELTDLRNRLKDASTEDWDAHRLLCQHLPDNDSDKALVVLKGHLLLEFMVRRFVLRRMINPDALEAGRLTGAAMICLAEALCLPNEEPRWLWARVKQVNTLRNKVAHRLDAKDLDERMGEFIDEIARRSELSSHSFVSAISCIYGMVKGIGDLADDPKYRLPR